MDGGGELERLFNAPKAYKPYRQPADGTQERGVYPFLVFEDGPRVLLGLHGERVPADTVEGDGLPSWDPKVQTVLLKGLSNARGQVVLEAGQIAPFHQALRETPGRVLLYVHEMTRFLPVTALDAQAWKRCIDPARRDAGACD